MHMKNILIGIMCLTLFGCVEPTQQDIYAYQQRRYTRNAPAFYTAYQVPSGEVVPGTCGEDPYAGIRTGSSSVMSARTLPYSFNSAYWIIYK